jgi:hypothetical protein
MIETPGIYDIPATEYHSDPCPAPSLSSSIARLLVSYSPWHAWYQHPRLNPAYEVEESDRFDLGTACHAYLLEQREDLFVVVAEEDWRKKAAQEARAAARAEGKVPLLLHQWEAVQAMAAAANRQLDVHVDPPRPFAFGKPERTLVWQDDGIWLRARLDWLHDHGGVIDDLKTTEMSAHPDAWINGPLFRTNYDLQAAFYLRGLRALGVEGSFRFVVQENYPPYALSVIAIGPEALESAEQELERAIAIWRRCLETNTWPGYPRRICYADLPPWERTRRLERRAREQYVDDGRDVSDQLMGEPR